MARTFYNKNNTPLNIDGRRMIQFKTFGQWDETIRVIQKLNPSIKACSVAAQMMVCNDIAKRVKAHIRNQDLNWPKLSPEYKKKKSKAGFNPKILLATKTYYNNIGVWRIGNQHFVFVGVRRGIYTYEVNGKRSRLDVATIAAIHEFSSGRKVPRRPLWNPTIAEMGGASGIKGVFVTELVKRLRAKGIPIKVINGFF